MEGIKNNLTQEEVLERINDFPIVPMRNRVIITTNVEERAEDELDLEGNAFSAEQFVMAVGSYAKDYLTPGQKVSLDLEAMAIRMPSKNDAYEPITRIMIKPVEVDGVNYGVITDDKIEYIVVR